MGYELLIRNGSPDRPIAEAVLAARLDAVPASGLADPPAQAPATPPAPAAAPPAPTPVPAAPEAAPVAASASPGPWSLRNGKGRMSARLSRIDGVLRGADLEIPFGGSEDELRRGLAFAVTLAESIGGLVFDPQLGREIGRGAAEEVVARWRQSQDWSVDVSGSYEDQRALVDLTPAPPLINRTNKIILAVVVGLLLLYWAYGAIGRLLR